MAVKFDLHICKLCGTCVAVCPVKCIIMEKDNIYIKDKCINCYKCIDVCPIGAVEENG